MILFISGSRFIHRLTDRAIEELELILADDSLGITEVVVGDANGVDVFIQKLIEGSVTVYATTFSIRNFANSNAKLVRVGNTFTARDAEMTKVCDYHIGFVTNKNPCRGTKSNHTRAIKYGKQSILFNVDINDFEDQ